MKNVLGNLEKGLLFVVSAPAGTGKTTLVRMLAEEFPCVQQSVSYTTRLPRPSEVDGIDYNFVDEAEFKKRIESGDFIEHVHLFDHYYGTSLSHIQMLQEQGKHVILVIDTEGALQLKEQVRATLIFISPPSVDHLRERMLKRSTEAEEVIQQRVARAEQELAAQKNYDYTVENDDLEIAYQVLRSVVIAVEHAVNK
ncbi:MAG: guanylate kinase [Waddliaceae bacterium]|nr:guanylate kinase [Waddliaceae bacterium]